MNEDKKSYIFTDNEKTHALIWEAYEGFIEHYNSYLMYISINVRDETALLGMKRYATFFYEEIRGYLDKFEKLFGKERIGKIKELMDEEKYLNKDNYSFLRRFFTDFMIKSGIKQIVKEKDEGPEVTKDR